MILACMRRSKHVQSAWILMILINLTHFFCICWKCFSKTHFIINHFSKNEKTFTLILNCETHEFVWFSREFTSNFLNFVTDLVPKTSFLFFAQKIKNLIALGFWQNRTIFMKKMFFSKIKKKVDVLEKTGSCQRFYFGKSSKFMISVLWKRRRSIAYFLHSARTTAPALILPPFYPNSPATTLIQLTKKKLIRTFLSSVAFFSSIWLAQ